MFVWAYRSLLRDRLRLAGSAIGVGLALTLVVFFGAVVEGESERVVAYTKNAGAQVWVMQKGVANLHMASSLLWDWKASQVQALDGVQGVTPILYMNGLVRAGGRDWFSYIVGLPEGASRGGPWKMRAGKPRPAAGEVVIPEVVAKLAGLTLGDEVRITGRSLRIVGLSLETFSMANSVTFVAWSDLEAIMDVKDALSYLLVSAKPGVKPADLARRIKASVAKVNAYSSTEFMARDREMALQMGTEIIRIMTLIGTAVAVLIVAFTAYTQVVRLEGELALVRALGFRIRHLAGAALVQSTLVSIFGLAVCAVFALWLVPLIPEFVPQISVRVTAAQIVRIWLIVLPVAILAGVVPALRIARIDPMLVIRSLDRHAGAKPNLDYS